MEQAMSKNSLINSVASSLSNYTTITTETFDSESRSDSPITIYDASRESIAATAGASADGVREQSTTFYIGDGIDSSTELLENNQIISPRRRDMTTISLIQNENICEHNRENDHHARAIAPSYGSAEYDAVERMLKVTTEKMAAQNSYDSGYGINCGSTRFISIDSDANMLGNDEIGANHYRTTGTAATAATKPFDSKRDRSASLIDKPSSSLLSNAWNRFIGSDPIQILIGVLLSAAGNFCAGLILDRIQNWAVFQHVGQLFYLIPLLLGLKGNLEMTMVARLSTMANTGKINDWPSTVRIMIRTVALVQCQATLVAFIASLVTVITTIGDSASHFDVNFWIRAALINASSIATANAACFASSILMMLLVVLFAKLKLNPDNFATAIAASFGDVITSGLFGVISQFIFAHSLRDVTDRLPASFEIDSMQSLQSPMFSIYVIVAFLAIFPFLAHIAVSDKMSREVLLSTAAWAPIFFSMMLSFVTGWLLRHGSSAFALMALFQPLINGVGGNLSAIATSRMSTKLHLRKTSGIDRDPELHPVRVLKILRRVTRSFFRFNYLDNQFVWIFVLIAAFVQFTWGIPLAYMSDSSRHVTLLFFVFYIAAAALQVFILMVLTRYVVHLIWYKGMDPDTSAIPLLTAMGDFLGTMFLLVLFATLRFMRNSAAVGNASSFATAATINTASSVNLGSPIGNSVAASVTYSYRLMA